MYRENFPVDSSGELRAVDFQYTGVLPASFMSFVVDTESKHTLPGPIRKTIPVKRSKNLIPMARACNLLRMAVSNFCVVYIFKF